MKKYKTLLIIIAIVAFLVALASLGRLTNKNSENSSGIILFYGDTCPHCKNVDDYLAANNIREKIKFSELEVYNNKKNAALLIATAKKCNLDASSGVGVPLLFDSTTCLQGDEPIINYFKTK